MGGCEALGSPPHSLSVGGGRGGGDDRRGFDWVVPVARFRRLEAWAVAGVRGFGGGGWELSAPLGRRRAAPASRARRALGSPAGPAVGERSGFTLPALAVRCWRGGARVAARAGQPRPGVLTGKFVELLKMGI